MSLDQSSLSEPTVLAFEDRHYSLGQLNALADGLAASLTESGVTAGDPVALMASNRPEFVVALKAIWRLAAVVVLISPAWKRHEVEHALALTNPSHALGSRTGGANCHWTSPSGRNPKRLASGPRSSRGFRIAIRTSPASNSCQTSVATS